MSKSHCFDNHFSVYTINHTFTQFGLIYFFVWINKLLIISFSVSKFINLVLSKLRELVVQFQLNIFHLIDFKARDFGLFFLFCEIPLF